MGRPPVIAVVGGGVAGLAAAWELAGGADALRGEQLPEVHVFESGDRLGGKLRSTEFAGRTIDLAADAFLSRRPEAIGLCKEIGAEGELVPVGASGASILARGRLRSMPDGLALGVPTRWLPLALSGVLGPMSTLRAGLDLIAPHLGTTGLTGDRAVGDIVGERLGRGVVERLVDPLVGGIHAGGVDNLSAAATFPMLIAASRQPGSFMRRLGRSQATASGPAPAGGAAMPAFWSLRGSTASLIDLLAARLVEMGVTIHVGAPVGAVTRIDEGERSPGTWRLVPGGEPLAEPVGTFDADGLVVAVPAAQAAALLAVHAPAAAGLLAAVEYAAVGVVTVAVSQGSVGRHLEGTGFLVPRTTRIGDRAALITGCTYLGRKWPHLARPGDELLRMSVGRFGDLRHADLDDDELTAACFGELAQILDISGAPTAAHVQRWDRALPQYRVDHLVKVATIEKTVASLPCVALAGSAYRGVGIPACVGSGRAAGRAVRGGLAVHSRRSAR
jgi:oxygen-dependent protoporphyrinogen oxidase